MVPVNMVRLEAPCDPAAFRDLYQVVCQYNVLGQALQITCRPTRPPIANFSDFLLGFRASAGTILLWL